jgi:4'-phosphopantetheinyl transferase
MSRIRHHSAVPLERAETARRNREVEWEFPPTKAVLGPDAVHLWCASLELPMSKIEAFEKTLSQTERKKAADLCSCQLRRHFIASHGLMRAILSRYVTATPSELEFANDPHGKPRLQGVAQAPSFNMAHSGELVIYAISARSEVGVDVERIRSLEHISLIASQFFSPREQAALHALSEADQLYGFFDYWTRKEALIKAFGGTPPDLEKCMETSTNRIGRPSAAQEIHHRWSLRSISPAPGYIAAVAVDSPTPHFCYWRWPDPSRSFFPGTARDAPGGFRNS